MQTTTLTTLAFSLALFTAAADNSRYVTLTATTNSGPATVQVQAGETAELLSAGIAGQPATGTGAGTSFQKNGVAFEAWPSNYRGTSSGQGTIVAGPATITLTAASAYGNPAGPVFLTVKLIPQTYDVNKTLILPPGTNQAFVTLESSTNLVTWADATNGVYGSPETVRFFRMRMDKLP